MVSSFFPLYLFILLQLYLISVQAAGGGGELIIEDGYTVSTVLDGDKSNIKVNPQSILHQSPPSDLFIILDSVASSFYTASLPINSNELGCCLVDALNRNTKFRDLGWPKVDIFMGSPLSEMNYGYPDLLSLLVWGYTMIKRLAGNGVSGYVDGDLTTAKFNKPKSFAVDLDGNIYVADPYNHAIRKVTKSGVTTIAGGYLQKTGKADGPARDATFSDDFELAFISEICALMISDHGNRLIRQISLKAGDCNTNSGSVLGTTSAWLLGMGLSCIISLAVGFVVRPCVLPYPGMRRASSVHLDMDSLPNESGETSTDAFLRHAKRSC